MFCAEQIEINAGNDSEAQKQAPNNQVTGLKCLNEPLCVALLSFNSIKWAEPRKLSSVPRLNVVIMYVSEHGERARDGLRSGMRQVR